MTLVRLAVVAVAAGAFGCATTSGSAWVRQPEPGPFAGDELAVAAANHSVEALDEPRSSRLGFELERDAVPPARPRLDRTVTLGEVVASYPERAPAAPVAERAPVSVTINNYVTPAPSGYGYYDGYYRAPLVVHRPGGGGRPHPAPRAAPTHPGQDWPAIPSYGPSFPFKTAPAAPFR
ncbi:MAG TPA: hypothetical protein VFZ53_00595 [Polyangiaceae bacterium]